MITVPFLDLSISDKKQREKLLSAMERVMIHGRIINGPELEEFEDRMCECCNRRFAVGVNSGTDALYMALRSLNIGEGDEVITTSLSWIATANAIALTGATPVFADIKDDLNIDPESVERLVTGRTKAILPVHYTGKVCDMEFLKNISEKHELVIVEDAAQAFGAKKNGKKAGSFGHLACFSMNAMKVYSAFGEAGMVVTDSEDLYERLTMLRYGGTINRETCIEPGLNGRMDTLQAAILLERLKNVSDIIEKRRQVAAWYHELLHTSVDIPGEKGDEYDCYYTYTIKAEQRNELKVFLESKGIETKIQHPILMPDQPAYKRCCRSECSNARRLVEKILCLPASEKISEKEVQYVSDTIKQFYKG